MQVWSARRGRRGRRRRGRRRGRRLRRRRRRRRGRRRRGPWRRRGRGRRRWRRWRGRRWRRGRHGRQRRRRGSHPMDRSRDDHNCEETERSRAGRVATCEADGGAAAVGNLRASLARQPLDRRTQGTCPVLFGAPPSTLLRAPSRVKAAAERRTPHSGMTGAGGVRRGLLLLLNRLGHAGDVRRGGARRQWLRAAGLHLLLPHHLILLDGAHPSGQVALSVTLESGRRRGRLQRWLRQRRGLHPMVAREHRKHLLRPRHRPKPGRERRGCGWRQRGLGRRGPRRRRRRLAQRCG